MTSDVIIVGGGVIGLSVAYRLACAGVGSTILDRRGVGGEGSGADGNESTSPVLRNTANH